MVKRYEEVSRRLNQIDFEALWPGFHPYPFALYTQREAILNGERFPTPEGFYGNTTISFGGRQIAIWNIETDSHKNLHSLTAGLVHEMFHAFQMEHGERRYPNDLALFAHAPTPESLAWKIWERSLLADQGAFSAFCTARLEHRNRFAVREEELLETAEGMAQFAEYRALGQLSRPLLLESLEQCRKRLRDASEAADVRRCGYDSGMYMLWRAAECGLNLSHEVGVETKTIFEILSQQTPAVPQSVRPAKEAIQAATQLLKEQKQQRRREIEAFYNVGFHRVNGPFQICGYDPTNMWRQEDVLFSRGFLTLKRTGGEGLNLQGTVLLNMEPNSNNRAIDCLIPEINP